MQNEIFQSKNDNEPKRTIIIDEQPISSYHQGLTKTTNVILNKKRKAVGVFA